MLSADQIISMSEEASDQAREEGLIPLSIRSFDPARPRDFLRKIPNLGRDYVPTGWERIPEVDPYMVDASGFGSESEPALTISAFIKRVEGYKLSGDNIAFGIVEVGEFQIVMADFRPDRRDFTHSGKLTKGELKLLH